MVTSVLHELADPCVPLQSKEWWFPFEGIAQHLMIAWEQFCRNVTQTGFAEELHATKDDYHAALLGYLKMLDGCLKVMGRLHAEDAQRELFDRISLNRDQLQKQYDSLFPRWQTLDDLEAMLLERVSLSNEQLKGLAEKNPPPIAWYEEADGQLASE